jgi:hypothetical protein
MLPMGAVSVSSSAPGLRRGSARNKSVPGYEPWPRGRNFAGQALVIERAARLRIGGLQHLKTPIQQVAVLAVRFDATTGPAGGLQHLHRHTPAVQAAGTCQPGDTAADDDDWVLRVCHGRFRLGLGFWLLYHYSNG